VITQNQGPGVLDITGRGEKNEGPDGTDPEEMIHSTGRRWPSQLGSVAAGELGKPRRVVAVPAAQLRARRGLLEPLVQVGVGRSDAARPEPVDEDAIAGRPCVVVVDAANLRLSMPRRHAINGVRPFPADGDADGLDGSGGARRIEGRPGCGTVPCLVR